MTRRGATSLRTPLVASPRAESNSSTPICQSDETLAPRLSVQRGLERTNVPLLGLLISLSYAHHVVCV